MKQKNIAEQKQTHRYRKQVSGVNTGEQEERRGQTAVCD